MNIQFDKIKLFLLVSCFVASGLLASDIPAQNPESVSDEFSVFVNKRPVRVFSDRAIHEIDSKQVDLRSNFKVAISGDLGHGPDGKIKILKNPKSVTAEGDPNCNESSVTVKFVQDAILAVGDAGYLGYLYVMKVRNVIISVEQTSELFRAGVKADQEKANTAKITASALNTFLTIAKQSAKDDEKLILSKMSSSADGKDFVLQFEMPRAEFHKFLDAKIAESIKTNAVGQAIK